MTQEDITLLSDEILSESGQDSSVLKQKALEVLQSIAGEWTDHNPSDPGITMLEAMAVQIADLSARLSYPIIDLLTVDPTKLEDRDMQHCFLAPEILSSNIVTLSDHRRAILDITGIKNVNFRTTSSTNAVTIEIDLEDSWSIKSESEKIALYEKVRSKFLSERNVNQDLSEIAIIPKQKVVLKTSLEYGVVTDLQATLVSFFKKILFTLSPEVKSVDFVSLSHTLSGDYIFDGPLLENGFIAETEFAKMVMPDSIYSSQLLEAISDEKDLKSVHTLNFIESFAAFEGLPRITIDSIISDTGLLDFVTTDIDGITINASLSRSLFTGENLQYSNDGETWRNITSSVVDSNIVYHDENFIATGTIHLQIEDGNSGNYGSVVSQLVVIVNVPDATISIDNITTDSAASSDFVTDDADGIIINAVLSRSLLEGETIQYSKNDGALWSDATSSNVSGLVQIAHTDSLFVSTGSVHFRINNGAAGKVTSQLIDIVSSPAPSAVINNDITIDRITVDSGAADFVTDDVDGIVIYATLTNALAVGEILEYSKDNGTTWDNITNISISNLVDIAHTDNDLKTTSTVHFRVNDNAGKYSKVKSQLIIIDNSAAIVNTVSIKSIDVDTGGADFVTSDKDGLTIYAKLSAPLSGDILQYSKDNGVIWVDISGSISDLTDITYFDSELTTTSTIHLRVNNGAGKYGVTSSQLVRIDGLEYWRYKLKSGYVVSFDLEKTLEFLELSIDGQSYILSSDDRKNIYAGVMKKETDDLEQVVDTSQHFFKQYINGRYRELNQHTSLQSMFPAIYQLTESSLNGDINTVELANVMQLKGYLLLFDQVLSDEFAQLEQLKFLFGLPNKDNFSVISDILNKMLASEVLTTEELEKFWSDLSKLPITTMSQPIRNISGFEHLLGSYFDTYQKEERGGFQDDAESIFSKSQLDRLYRSLTHILSRFSESTLDSSLLKYAAIFKHYIVPLQEASGSTCSKGFVTDHNTGLFINADLSQELLSEKESLHYSVDGINWIDITDVSVFGRKVTFFASELVSTQSVHFCIRGGDKDINERVESQLISISSDGDSQATIKNKISISHIVNDMDHQDFVTDDNDGLVIYATLEFELKENEILQYSKNNGMGWKNITDSVNNKSITHIDNELVSMSVVHFRVYNSFFGTYGQVSSQLINIVKELPDITVSIDSISNDTGVLGDFVTDDSNGLTITATLSRALSEGEMLHYSRDGYTWMSLTDAVVGTSLSYEDVLLISSSTIHMRVHNGITSKIVSQLISIVGSLPSNMLSNHIVSIDSIDNDTGKIDFITEDDDGVVINATLFSDLNSNEIVQYSNDGIEWSNITSSVLNKSVKYFADKLINTNVVHLRVFNTSNSEYSRSTSQIIIIKVPKISIRSISTDLVSKLVTLKQITDLVNIISDYPSLSRYRCGGFNYLDFKESNVPPVIGLGKRIMSFLGFSHQDQIPLATNNRESMYILESALLRYGDSSGKWSHTNLFFVVPEWPSRFANNEFRSLLKQQINYHTPVHQSPYLILLPRNLMSLFERLYFAWINALSQRPLVIAQKRITSMELDAINYINRISYFIRKFIRAPSFLQDMILLTLTDTFLTEEINKRLEVSHAISGSNQMDAKINLVALQAILDLPTMQNKLLELSLQLDLDNISVDLVNLSNESDLSIIQSKLIELSKILHIDDLSIIKTNLKNTLDNNHVRYSNLTADDILFAICHESLQAMFNPKVVGDATIGSDFVISYNPLDYCKPNFPISTAYINPDDQGKLVLNLGINKPLKI